MQNIDESCKKVISSGPIISKISRFFAPKNKNRNQLNKSANSSKGLNLLSSSKARKNSTCESPKCPTVKLSQIHKGTASNNKSYIRKMRSVPKEPSEVEMKVFAKNRSTPEIFSEFVRFDGPFSEESYIDFEKGGWAKNKNKKHKILERFKSLFYKNLSKNSMKEEIDSRNKELSSQRKNYKKRENKRLIKKIKKNLKKEIKYQKHNEKRQHFVTIETSNDKTEEIISSPQCVEKVLQNQIIEMEMNLLPSYLKKENTSNNFNLKISPCIDPHQLFCQQKRQENHIKYQQLLRNSSHDRFYAKKTMKQSCSHENMKISFNENSHSKNKPESKLVLNNSDKKGKHKKADKTVNLHFKNFQITRKNAVLNTNSSNSPDKLILKSPKSREKFQPRQITKSFKPMNVNRSRNQSSRESNKPTHGSKTGSALINFSVYAFPSDELLFKPNEVRQQSNIQTNESKSKKKSSNGLSQKYFCNRSNVRPTVQSRQNIKKTYTTQNNMRRKREKATSSVIPTLKKDGPSSRSDETIQECPGHVSAISFVCSNNFEINDKYIESNASKYSDTSKSKPCFDENNESKGMDNTKEGMKVNESNSEQSSKQTIGEHVLRFSSINPEKSQDSETSMLTPQMDASNGFKKSEALQKKIKKLMFSNVVESSNESIENLKRLKCDSSSENTKWTQRDFEEESDDKNIRNLNKSPNNRRSFCKKSPFTESVNYGYNRCSTSPARGRGQSLRLTKSYNQGHNVGHFPKRSYEPRTNDFYDDCEEPKEFYSKRSPFGKTDVLGSKNPLFKHPYASDQPITKNNDNLLDSLNRWRDRKSIFDPFCQEYPKNSENMVTFENSAGNLGDTNAMQAIYTICLDDYRFLGKIAEGIYGKVLFAKNISFGKKCAIKMVDKQYLHGLEDHRIFDENYISKYIPGIVNKSPFMVHIVDIFQTKQHYFFVTEFMEYGNLEMVLLYQGYFEYTQVKFYSAGILLALNYLHEQKLVHRNLKLCNVLVDSKGYPRLSDFGRSRCLFQKIDDDTGSAEGPQIRMEGVEYIAPEVFTDNHYDYRVDIWALAACIVYMLTGQLQKNWQNLVDFLDEIQEQYSSTITNLLKSMTKLNPSLRLGSGILKCMEILNHPFYEVIDWYQYNEKRYIVPVPNKACRTGYTPMTPELYRMIMKSIDNGTNSKLLKPIILSSPNAGKNISPRMTSLHPIETGECQTTNIRSPRLCENGGPVFIKKQSFSLPNEPEQQTILEQSQHSNRLPTPKMEQDPSRQQGMQEETFCFQNEHNKENDKKEFEQNNKNFGPSNKAVNYNIQDDKQTMNPDKNSSEYRKDLDDSFLFKMFSSPNNPKEKDAEDKDLQKKFLNFYEENGQKNNPLVSIPTNPTFNELPISEKHPMSARERTRQFDFPMERIEPIRGKQSPLENFYKQQQFLQLRQMPNEINQYQIHQQQQKQLEQNMQLQQQMRQMRQAEQQSFYNDGNGEKGRNNPIEKRKKKFRKTGKKKNIYSSQSESTVDMRHRKARIKKRERNNSSFSDETSSQPSSTYTANTASADESENLGTKTTSSFKSRSSFEAYFDPNSNAGKVFSRERLSNKLKNRKRNSKNLRFSNQDSGLKMGKKYQFGIISSKPSFKSKEVVIPKLSGRGSHYYFT